MASSSLSHPMRAVIMSPNLQGEESLEHTKDAVAPDCMPTEVIIRVSACGVSQLDKRIVCGDLSDIKPSTGKLGFEVSGTIEKIGHSVEGYAVGDEVVAAIPADVGGGFAELVAVSIYSIAKRPSTVTDIEGAALVNDGILAFTAIHYKCHFSGGDTILILNGCTPHGWLCMQLASHFGLQVTVTANSKEDVNALHSAGITNLHIIDMTSESLLEAAMTETGYLGFDHVLQLDPQPTISRMTLITLLAPQGTWVTAETLQLDPPEATLLLRKSATLAFAFQPIWLLAPTQIGRFLHVLTTIMELAGQGALKPRTISTYPLERARQAIRDLGSKPGKFVLRV